MKSVRELSAQQKEAVWFPLNPTTGEMIRTGKKHLVIEAGAGAGKTTLLTERVHWLLNSAPQTLKLDASELVLVTFSRAADEELRARVEKRLSESTLTPEHLDKILSRLHISTIDSLFMQLVSNVFPIWWEEKRAQIPESLLKAWGLSQQRFPPLPALVTEEELFPELAHLVINFVQENATSTDEEFATLDFVLAGAFEGKGFRTHGSAASPYRGLERITAAMLHENVLREDAPPLHFALEKIHPASIQILMGIQALARLQFQKRIMQGRLTHNDRMLFLYHMLVAYPLLEEHSFFKTGPHPHSVHRYRELIVDEYQDTNELQHKILSALLAPNVGRMVVVGDPKQSIYGFRSAHVGVFQQLKTDEQWKVIELTRNFRSHPDLLPWINYLSELSFAFRNNKIPEEFLGTSFSLSAQRTFVSSKSLDAGRASDRLNPEPTHPRILQLGASLSKERSTLSVPEDAPSQHAFTCQVLAHELQNLTQSGHYRWKDIVILCETNDWVVKTQQQMKLCGIPTVAKTSRPAEANSESRNRSEDTGLLLAKWLCTPLNLSEFSRLMWSGYFDLTPLEVSMFIRSASDGTLGSLFLTPTAIGRKLDLPLPQLILEKWNKMKEHITSCRQLAGQHFFSAWQVFRWTWPQMQTRAQNLINLDMENVAFALHQSLQIWSLRASLEASAAELYVLSHKIRDEDLPPNLDRPYLHQNPGFWPEELLEHQIKQLRLTELSADPNLNAVNICTIHGAKGLEWPIVVFWPGSKRERAPENFVMKSGDRATHVKWLAEDTQSASLLPWVNNPTPPNDVVSVYVESAAGEQTVRWSADLQDRLEQDYERQRVFYTAFTRAREMLILCSPAVSGRTQKNLRDKLSVLRKSDDFDTVKLKITGLESSVFGLFADSFFDLRKEDKRGSRPQHPWQGRVVDAKVKNDDWQQVLALRDYGPDWLETLKPQPSLEDQSTDSEFDHSEKTLSKDWRDFWADQQFLKALSTPWANNTEASFETKQSDIRIAKTLDSEAIDADDWTQPNELPKLTASESGLRFHALMEHGDTFGKGKKNFINQLRSDALVFENELEFWGAFDVEQTEDEAANQLQKTQRKIIDLFCVLPSSKWPKNLWNSPCVRENFEAITTFRKVLENKIPFDPHLHLVIDFKTGQPSSEHLKQMRLYLNWVGETLRHHPQLLVNSPTQATLFAGTDKPLIGILFYTSANISSNSSDFASCFVGVDKTTSLLFVSPE